MQQIPVNKTKIISTLGPATRSEAVLESLIKAGVDVFRLNFSHSTHEEHADAIDKIVKLNERLGTHVAILADLQGPKIRTGEMPEEGMPTETGNTLVFNTSKETLRDGEIYVSYDDFARDVKAGQRILIDDGKILLKAKESNGVSKVKAEVIYGGRIKSRKGINLPDTKINTPSLTPKDLKDLDFILEHNVNWIALSFVRDAEDIVELKEKIAAKNRSALVIAKIEKPEAIENIDSIISATDAVMIARGDLGVEIPLEDVPVQQKRITEKCIRAAKPVIVATQMMESMIESASPTRAEVTDVANAIFDGADAVMLSGETATGKHPVKVIETITKILERVEKQNVIYDRYNVAPKKGSEHFLSQAICYNACKIASDVNARAILGMTRSGFTGFQISSYRPKADIFIFTENPSLPYITNLSWGLRVFLFKRDEQIDETFDTVQDILLKKGLVQEGDIVVNTGGLPVSAKGRTNTIKISRIDSNNEA